MQVGYFLSCEEYGPADLVEQAVLAERAGFSGLWISDHFHPWNDEQGQSPFVWSVIGAISQVCSLPVTTAVTCPTVRLHPALVAQAAATSATLLGGRFVLGVGSGEALNEHILGGPWPHAARRLEMLEEAVEVIRALWTGEVVSHAGEHYTVDTARIGDGFITTKPDGEAVAEFRRLKGDDRAPTMAGLKVAYAETAAEGLDHAHRLWANSGVPGEVAQVLPSPQHFEQASTLVTREATAESVVCGNDAQQHREAFTPYAEAGFDEVFVANMGPRWREMIEFYGEQVLPQLS